jgi:choline dehydrogenase
MCKAELSPGMDVRTDTELREFIRRDLATLYHPVGTCAMGGGTRFSSGIGLVPVVDAQLRVIGVDNLRVADASVMPTVPRGNTNAPVIALAERAADLISGRAPLAPVEIGDLALASTSPVPGR